MHKSIALTALVLAGASTAQIPLPAFVRTYSASATRGFYFQTPVPIVITGLRVPDESNFGIENVEVFKMSAAPPAYPATASGGQVLYMTGVPSNQVIPCALVFLAGDYVGVLGACGNSSILNNSYAATGPFNSNVLGNPITLTRFLTQSNIVASGGNQPYSSEAAFEVCRIQVFVAGQSSAIDYGMGTGVGAPAPALTTTALPSFGQTATLSLTQSNSVNQGGVLALATSRASIPFLGGTLLLSPPIPVVLPLGVLPVGPTGINIPIPNNPTLSALALDFQCFVLVAPGLAMSNGTEWVVGY